MYKTVFSTVSADVEELMLDQQPVISRLVDIPHLFTDRDQETGERRMFRLKLHGIGVHRDDLGKLSDFMSEVGVIFRHESSRALTNVRKEPYVSLKLTVRGPFLDIISNGYGITRFKSRFPGECHVMSMNFKMSKDSTPGLVHMSVDTKCQALAFDRMALCDDIRKLVRARLGNELPDMSLELVNE